MDETATINASGFALLLLVLLIVVAAGVIVLQVFLSKKENKWLGLILPTISLLASLIVAVGIVAYTAQPALSVTKVFDKDGTLIQEIAVDVSQEEQNIPSILLTVGSVFLIYNIPTIIFLAIYFAARESQRRKKALNKMQALDLQ
jgi:hypothetical protein